jgi:hypothetical protein
MSKHKHVYDYIRINMKRSAAVIFKDHSDSFPSLPLFYRKKCGDMCLEPHHIGSKQSEVYTSGVRVTSDESSAADLHSGTIKFRATFESR